MAVSVDSVVSRPHFSWIKFIITLFLLIDNFENYKCKLVPWIVIIVLLSCHMFEKVY